MASKLDFCRPTRLSSGSRRRAIPFPLHRATQVEPFEQERELAVIQGYVRRPLVRFLGETKRAARKSFAHDAVPGGILEYYFDLHRAPIQAARSVRVAEGRRRLIADARAKLARGELELGEFLLEASDLDAEEEQRPLDIEEARGLYHALLRDLRATVAEDGARRGCHSRPTKCGVGEIPWKSLKNRATQPAAEHFGC